MIIQCQTCKTKYRFDETLITGEGAWVRCSRCQDVFFQGAAPGTEARREAVLSEPAMEQSPALEREVLPDAIEEPVFPDQGGKRSTVTTWALVLVFVLLIAAGVAYTLYTSAGAVVLKKISTVFPVVGAFLPGETSVSAVGPAQVKIVDLKQRFVENALMGNIRVVEGMAVNGSAEPMTRIKVRAELYDVIGTPVRQNEAYGGNLLTDQELKTATEEQIVRKLAVPQGTDISNDRVTPKGMVPFMIIFLREPPGVAKTLVMPIEAERLLP